MLTKQELENIALTMAMDPKCEWTAQVQETLGKDANMAKVLLQLGLVKKSMKVDKSGQLVPDGKILLPTDEKDRSRNYLTVQTHQQLSDDQISQWESTMLLTDVNIEMYGRTLHTKVVKMDGENFATVFMTINGKEYPFGFLVITTDSRSPWIVPSSDTRPKFMTFTQTSRPNGYDLPQLLASWIHVNKEWKYVIITNDGGERKEYSFRVDRGIVTSTLIQKILDDVFGIETVIPVSTVLPMSKVVAIKQGELCPEDYNTDVDNHVLELKKEALTPEVDILLDSDHIGHVTFERNEKSLTSFRAIITFDEPLALPLNAVLLRNATAVLLGCGSNSYNTPSAEIQQEKEPHQKKGFVKKGKKFGGFKQPKLADVMNV